MTHGVSARVLRRRRQVAVGLAATLVLVVALLLSGLGGSSPVPGTATTTPDAEGGAEPPAEVPLSDGPDGLDDGAAPAATPPPAEPLPAEPPPAEPLPAEPLPAEALPAEAPADPATALAGILAPGVPDVGSGSLDAVPGTVAAPAPQAEVVQVRVTVEGDLPVDGSAFAALVMATLNDPRSWTRDGYSFARTDGQADLEVTLASPQTSAQLCRPLDTGGRLSCRNGDRAVLTYYRWVHGTEDYAADLTGYRQYVVNHEVGHYLGHGHVGCPGAGRPAPVMMQQTKGLGACVPSAWPYP